MAKKRSLIHSWLPRSLAVRGCMLILLAALFAAGPTWWAQRSAIEARAARHFANDQALLAVALKAYLELAGPEAGVEDWIDRVSDGQERVRWAGVFRSPDDGLEFRRTSAISREQTTRQIDFTATTPDCVPLSLGTRSSERYSLLTVPQSDGGMLAAIIDTGAGTTNAPMAGIALAFGVAAAGLLVVLALFQHLILRPMAVLSRSVNGIGDELSRLDGDTPQELAGLLASAEAAQRELREWRAQATQLRTAMDIQSERAERHAEQAESRAEERDSQTGLLNAATLERDLPALLARQAVDGHELTLMIIDLDGFDAFASRHGDTRGGELLTFVGGLLRSCTRRGVDLAARYGNSQFVLALPDTPPSRAVEVAGRLAAMFGQKFKTLGCDSPVVAVCAGVASLQEHKLTTPDALLIAAGQALTRGRRHGTSVMSYERLFAGASA